MSKLYKKYLELKNENPEKYYLFHSGIFYIFLAEDSAYLSKKLGLKQTKFTDEVNKCGFPQNSKAKYFASYIMVRAFTQFFLHTQLRMSSIQQIILHLEMQMQHSQAKTSKRLHHKFRQKLVLQNINN